MTAPLTDVLATLLVDIREAASELHAEALLSQCLETVTRRHTAMAERLETVTAERDKLAASVRASWLAIESAPIDADSSVPDALISDLKAGRLTDATELANALDELTRSIT